VTRADWLPAAVAAIGVVGIVAAGSVVPAPSEAVAPLRTQTQPLSGAVQACPAALDAPEASTDVAAQALEDPGITVDADASGVIDIVALGDDGPGAEALESTSERGTTLSTAVQSAVAVRASGALAPGLVAETTTTAAGERSIGLASQPCVEPGREWWFAGGSGGVGRRGTLVLTNSSDGAAVVDVSVWTEQGLLAAAGTSDLGVPPGGTRTVALDAVASGAERSAVLVSATVGRVGAALFLRDVDGADPIGLSWVTPSRAPARLAYVPGLPAFGERTLRLVNTGEEDAIVGLRALSGQGPFTPVGLEAIDAPAGQVVDVDLEAAGEEAFALEVSSTQPVVSSVILRQTPSSGLGDLAVLGSASALDTIAASRITSEDARSSRLVLTALPDAEANPGASPDATPTATVTPTATATQTVAATPSATATPEESGEPDEFINVTTPTTQVAVTLIGLDGAVLDSNVATIGLGTTDTFPLDLPEGSTDAWVLVEPSQPGVVMAARETTSTVTTPDPLDPDAQREAFWLDVVPLRSTRVSVEVAPVVPDITAGLVP
jgi:hypothetical protein